MMPQNPQDLPGSEGRRVPPPVPPMQAPAQVPVQTPMQQGMQQGMQPQIVQPLGYAPPPMILKGDLRTVAVRQKAVMYCILGYFVALVLQFVLPRELRPVSALLALGMVITATVFVFMLALSLYSTGIGVLLGILTLVPCVGLITLLIVNGKATQVLRAHGVHVGLMGADSSQLPGAGVMIRE